MVPEPRDLGNIIESKLIEMGLFRHIGEHSPDLQEGRVTTGYGYPITGLEKFLGYFDKTVNIANFPSISVTTDFSYSTAVCRYTKEDGMDSVSLDGREDPRYTEKSRKALQFFKSLYEVPGSFQFYIERTRKYEDAKGLGESASVAAAVSRALMENVFGSEGLADTTLASRFARMVSGSGTRSVSGGLSIWLSYPYMDESHSAGYFIREPGSEMHIGAFPMPSRIVTDNAHKMAESSDFYGRWVSSKYQHILSELDDGFDIGHLLSRSQEDMYTLNSVILSRGHFIQTPGSLSLIYALKEFQDRNEGLFFTADTGPSIVLLSRDRKLIQEFVSERPENFIWSGTRLDRPEIPGGLEERADGYFNRKR